MKHNKMTSKAVAVLIMLGMQFVDAVPPPPPPPPPNLGDFTYYKLAVSWPIAFCKVMKNGCSGRVKCLPKEFVIHGLWPQGAPTQSNEPFRPKSIENMRGDLRKYWMNAYTYPDAKIKEEQVLWEHEWRSHGTQTDMSQQEYFATGLSLGRDVLKLYNMNLKRKYPGGPGPINITQLADDFESLIARPYVKCKQQMVHELEFLIKKEGHAFTSIREAKHQVCGGQDEVVLPGY